MNTLEEVLTLDRYVLEGVATDSAPIKTPTPNCSMRVAYIPALIIGIAQQQYSRGFMVDNVQEVVKSLG